MEIIYNIVIEYTCILLLIITELIMIPTFINPNYVKGHLL